MEKVNLVSDVDGTLSSGEHFYSKDGKIIKSFGSNDKEAAALLSKYIDKIVFCSADSSVNGQIINEKRFSEFKNVEYIICSIEKRQELINSMLPCIYIGDGLMEPRATINFCLLDSSPQAIQKSDVVLPTVAGKNVLAHLLNWFEEQNVYNFAKTIRSCMGAGKIVLAGVGKNYSLAQLVSEFFLPYNIIAVPLDANHSLHGSLGLIKNEDILIASSKSGNTKELVEMMQSLKKKLPEFKNTFLITSSDNSICSELFEHVLVVPSLEENSLHNLSPQTTISQYLNTYFQILNIINTNNKCTKNDYLLNHQGGSIGKTRT